MVDSNEIEVKLVMNLNVLVIRQELEKLVKELTKKMRQAAAELNFEAAAELRDKMVEIKKMLLELE